MDEIIQVQMRLRGTAEEVERIKKYIAASTLFDEVVSLSIKEVHR